MRRLFRPLLILLALVFLFEAWLWSHLAPVVAWVVAHIPLRAIKARLRALIDRLPPAATLVVFIVPVLLLLPLKFLGLWMLAHGSWLGALGVLAFAKMLSVGVTAFIFDVTQPKLMQMAVVPMALRPRDGRLGLGARIDRSDQAPAQDASFECGGRGVRDAHCDCSHASGGGCRRHDRRQIRWSECRKSGLKNPSAMKPSPTMPRPPAT